MRKWLNMYFSFSKREYNGLMVLVVLLVMISVLPVIFEKSWVAKDISPEERKAIQQLTIIMDEDKRKHQNQKNSHVDTKLAVLFKFDPNLISAAQWQSLGLSAKQAAAILNYRSKGGKFYQPEDLKKMYTISADVYKLLSPYIVIAKKSDSLYINKYKSAKYTPKQAARIISLNSADTLELDQIKGIGLVFAKRIIKYRVRLGGFYKKDQLLEVFGLDSIKFEEIKDQIYLDDNHLVKINVNTAIYETFKGHPYLSSKQINAIIQYRKQHGNYSNIADLKKVAILSATDVEKIAPYLSF